MSSDLNENNPAPENWEVFQIIPLSDRKALSNKLRMKLKVIDELCDFISQYTKVLHDSFQLRKTHCTITIDGKSLDMSIKDQATLSLLHHKHIENNIRLTDKVIPLKANYTLNVSGTLIEARVQQLIDALEAQNLLLPYEVANNIINPDNQQGNRPHDETALRHTIIREAARILKRNGYERSYAKKLAQILPHFGFPEFTSGNIRKIVNA
jgi:hypothetical protein